MRQKKNTKRKILRNLDMNRTNSIPIKNTRMNHQIFHLYTLPQPQGTKPRNPPGFVKSLFKSPNQFRPVYCDTLEGSGEGRERTRPFVKGTVPSCGSLLDKLESLPYGILEDKQPIHWFVKLTDTKNQ